jgi:hypothetical protein
LKPIALVRSPEKSQYRCLGENPLSIRVSGVFCITKPWVTDKTLNLMSGNLTLREASYTLARISHQPLSKRAGEKSGLIKAAYLVDDESAGGLGHVFDQLDDQPWGELWLGIIALGFIAYAGYMVAAAFYRKFPSFSPKRF